MAPLNVEIKARCRQPEFIRNYLKNNGAIFKGVDHQTDTYFNVLRGRLKLREGNIENNLIYYERKDEENAKESRFQLVNIHDAGGLKEALSKAVGVKIVVEKKREIYFIENVKFHIDEVSGLGSFAEIEASNLHWNIAKDELQSQCNFYMNEFGIQQKDLIGLSYSDMLLAAVGTA
ncbi:MAG TPA: class IV adenylate cyclase [Chitinophagaceae bacterium]|nr:class IV adenylate cyclase [Chitinophagaceae bacterium]